MSTPAYYLKDTLAPLVDVYDAKHVFLCHARDEATAQLIVMALNREPPAQR